MLSAEAHGDYGGTSGNEAVLVEPFCRAALQEGPLEIPASLGFIPYVSRRKQSKISEPVFKTYLITVNRGKA